MATFAGWRCWARRGDRVRIERALDRARDAGAFLRGEGGTLFLSGCAAPQCHAGSPS